MQRSGQICVTVSHCDAVRPIRRQIGLPRPARVGKFGAMLRPAFRNVVFAAAATAVLATGPGPAGPALADDTPRLPRFASLGVPKVYLRQGPTYKNRILWVYRRQGLPVEILAQFDVWRRVRMPDGAVGWMHVAMLSSTRTVVVTGKAKVPLRAAAASNSKNSGLGPARRNCEARSLSGRRLRSSRRRDRWLVRQEEYLGSAFG